MNKAQKLRLGRGGVANEKTVDFVSEPAPARLAEILLRAAKQLAENTLLHVFVLPDRRREGPHQNVIEIISLREFLHFEELFRSDLGLAHVELGLRFLSEGDNVHVGVEHASRGSARSGQALALRLVNADALHSVSGTDAVDEAVVDEQVDGVGSLALGDVVWGLLELD